MHEGFVLEVFQLYPSFCIFHVSKISKSKGKARIKATFHLFKKSELSRNNDCSWYTVWWNLERWKLTPWQEISRHRALQIINELGKQFLSQRTEAHWFYPESMKKKSGGGKSLGKHHRAQVCGLSNLTLRCWIIFLLFDVSPGALVKGLKMAHHHTC